jgi:hypothetical protein
LSEAERVVDVRVGIDGVVVLDCFGGECDTCILGNRRIATFGLDATWVHDLQKLVTAQVRFDTIRVYVQS